MPKKSELFISHAVADGPVAKQFVNLIESGIGVAPDNIFFTSNKGQGIKPGRDFKSSIHNSLDEATIVIALISENYYNSPFCMCELGGAWLQAKDLIPVLIPPIRFSDMKAVLIGMQSLQIGAPQDLDELRDELSERLNFKPLVTPRWNEKRDEFLNILTNKLKEIPHSPVVQREKFDKANDIIAEYKAEITEIKNQNDNLHEQNKKLKGAKNSDEVAIIIREDMEDADIFENLIAELKENLGNLDSVTKETIYVSLLGDDYFPGRESSYYTWDDVQSPIQYKEVSLN
ncbi:MAG: toll/interleukin-1 receptor domain-containing protein, partial [Desulfobacterales bacterium]|nr:toll/interleukin-1 receptor domain-containing protein [Desulfobacterales bacterium]